MPLHPGVRLGPYEILAPIGAGGMGEVYRARDTRLGRDVAIKVLPAEFAADPERLKRFKLEARAAAALNHPSILMLYDIGTHDGAPYLVMELLEGDSLRQRLRGGPLTPAKAVEFGIQVAQGLATAHEKGIVHRDLKPENLFVTKDGRLKILDFGLARLRPEAEGGTVQSQAATADSPTREGRVLGTPGYMAPEQVRGQQTDARSDIFAFGAVLYEMLAGKRAFSGDTAADTQAAILAKDPDPLLPVTPQSLDRVVRRCLEKRPEDRYLSAHELLLALEVASSAPQAPISAALSAPACRGWTLRQWARLSGATLLLAVSLSGLLLWHSWKPKPTHPVPASPSVPSLVALPCKVYGAPEEAFLTDAVPETISTLLARTEGLDTKVPPTSIEVEKVKGDLATLAQLYQVSNFVVTSINASSGNFALNVQLVDAATRKVWWGRQFEGTQGSYNDLARQAAEGVRQAFDLGASPMPTPAISSEVELALREGDYFSHRYAEYAEPTDPRLADFNSALQAYQRAMAADDGNAGARADAGHLCYVKFTVEGSKSGALKDAETWAHRALDLDPRCGQAWALLSMLEWMVSTPNPERQVDYALKAASLAPRTGYCHMAVSNAIACPGSLSLCLSAARKSVDVDPFMPGPNGNVIEELSLLGRPGEAEPFVDHLMRVAPDNCYYAYTKGLMLLKLGRLDEARAAMDRWAPNYRERPDGPNSQLWGQARFRLAAAEHDTATLERLEKNIISPLLDGRAKAWQLENGTLYVCPALAALGRKDDSLRILLRSVEMGVPPPYDFLLIEPGFKPLQGDPRFAKVVTASRKGAAWIAGILEQARARGELPAYLNQPLAELEKLLKSPNGTT